MADHNSIYCPNCRQRTSIEKRARQDHRGNGPIYEIGECNNCEQRLLVVRDYPSGSIAKTYPTALPKAVDEIIPQPIRGDLEEAYLCLSVGALRAVATMARRAVQNICLEKGAPKTRKIGSGDKEREINNDLVHQVDWLYTEHIITGELKDWAHEVRVIGNAGAHPGDAEDQAVVTSEDAETAIELAEALCSTLYVKSKIYRDRHATES